MNSKLETGEFKNVLICTGALKEKIRVKILTCKRERISVIGVDPDVQETEVSDAITKVLDESLSEGSVVKGLTIKLKDPGLDPQTKNVLQELYSESSLDFKVMRKNSTRQVKNNCLVDVDDKGKNYFLKKKRICLDYERYRMVEFITIMRCFKCQVFGHIWS